MTRFSKGDEAGFAEVYDAIAPLLLGFLRKATRDECAADDLLQQTLLQMHRTRGSFIPGEEAAEVLGTSVSVVKQSARRAYEALRAVLREGGDAP